jgi:ribosomal protein S18 acetylase RimI-like enzyme
MPDIKIIERDISSAELAEMQAGFEQHQLEYSVPIKTPQRYTTVATSNEKFIGCASGLQYHEWLYLTDLWLEKSFRKQGLGGALLEKLESRLLLSGVKQIYTWTAGYEAPGFYKKHGYTVFCELENYYPTGDSCVGLRKIL